VAIEKAKMNGILSAGGILDRIVEQRIARIQEAKKALPLKELLEHVALADIRHSSFIKALSRTGRPNIIAEVKRQSPSKGIIRKDFNHLEIAGQYAKAGAAAMSVLTEEDFFGGSLAYLREIHGQTDVPLLRKDFIIDEYQIFEAALAGASAILLITAILDDELLAAFLHRAEEVKLDALVEVHTEAEMGRAIAAGANLIGVNNRDLTTFTVDLQTSVRLAPLAPENVILVSESGITTRDDIDQLRAAGYQAFLIGEHLMRQPDVEAALKGLVE
jgi:indole-3-glycerol phosphate synthase